MRSSFTGTEVSPVIRIALKGTRKASRNAAMTCIPVLSIAKMIVGHQQIQNAVFGRVRQRLGQGGNGRDVIAVTLQQHAGRLSHAGIVLHQ